MDVKAKKCQRLRRRVEELEKAVMELWDKVRQLWDALAPPDAEWPLPDEPVWMKRLKKYRAAAPHPCGGERPSGRETGKEVRREDV